MAPAGIPSSVRVDRGIWILCRETKRGFLVCFTRLFKDGGDGMYNGTAFDRFFEKSDASEDVYKGEPFRPAKVASPFTMDELARVLFRMAER